MSRFLLPAILIVVVASQAVAAEPCAPIGGDTSLVRCPTLAAVEELASTLAQKPRVTPKGLDPLRTYQDTILAIGARVPVTPVLFLGRPMDSPAEASHFHRYGTRGIIRARLWSNPQRMKQAFWVIERRAEARGDGPDELRHYVLRDGYLYTEDPALAERWQTALALGQLWTTSSVVLQRGDALIPLERDGARFVRAAGPAKGTEEQLRVFDRVAASAADVGAPVALDLERLREAHGLARITVAAVSGGQAKIHAVTAMGDIVPGVIIHDGVRTRLLLAHADRGALEALLHRSRALASEWRSLRDMPLGFDEQHGGGDLLDGRWARVDVPAAARAPWSAQQRFLDSLDGVPDRFHEGDVLVVDVDGDTRAWIVWQVDPIEGRPLMLLDGAAPRALGQVLDAYPSAHLVARLRRNPVDVTRH